MVKGSSTRTKEKINRIKEVLVMNDKSQKWLAEALNRNANTVSNICNNITQPSLHDLKTIAKLLKVDIRELLHPTKV